MGYVGVGWDWGEDTAFVAVEANDNRDISCVAVAAVDYEAGGVEDVAVVDWVAGVCLNVSSFFLAYDIKKE